MKLNRLLLRLSSPAIAGLLFGATAVGTASAQKPAQTSATAVKTFIDYFQLTPILSPLSTTAWGVATVGPRDQKNGLEDPTMKLWDYWDGQIIHGPDGKYHLRQPLGPVYRPQRLVPFQGRPRRQRQSHRALHR